MIYIRFKGYDCQLEFGEYENGRTVIILNDLQDDVLVAVATINIPDFPLAPDFVLIKDYSENKGMLKTLMEAKVIAKPLLFIQTGAVSIPVCHLLIKPEKYD